MLHFLIFLYLSAFEISCSAELSRNFFLKPRDVENAVRGHTLCTSDENHFVSRSSETLFEKTKTREHNEDFKKLPLIH